MSKPLFKMAIRYTSRLALAELSDSLTGLRLEVYRAIAKWDPAARGPGPSIEDLATELGRKECSICARVSELRKAGLIEEAPIKTNSSGMRAMTYRALDYREPSVTAPRVDHTGQAWFF